MYKYDCDLFGNKINKPINEFEYWVDMPEYDNIREPEPEITVLFKFRNKEDFEVFNKLLKKHVYKTSKVFDGKQQKTKKQVWFPLKDKTNYEYV